MQGLYKDGLGTPYKVCRLLEASRLLLAIEHISRVQRHGL